MTLLTLQIAAAGASRRFAPRRTRAHEHARARPAVRRASRWSSCSPACRSRSRWASSRSASCTSSCRRPRSTPSRRTSTRRWPSITLLSIPLFILKGAAIGKSRAGQATCTRRCTPGCSAVPGGLGIANVFACALFAAMAGSSPATCSAIGSAGIPGDAQARLFARLRRRHHRRRRHARHPAAAVDHDDPVRGRRRAVAGPPVPRRHRPGPAAGRAVRAATRSCRFRKEYRAGACARSSATGTSRPTSTTEHYTLREKVEMLPRVLPFVILLIGVMVALYGGFATPSETAGLGARAGAGADRRRLRHLAAARPGADPRRDAARSRPC